MNVNFDSIRNVLNGHSVQVILKPIILTVAAIALAILVNYGTSKFCRPNFGHYQRQRGNTSASNPFQQTSRNLPSTTTSSTYSTQTLNSIARPLTSSIPPNHALNRFPSHPTPSHYQSSKQGGTYELNLTREDLVMGSRDQIENFSRAVLARGLEMTVRVRYAGEAGSDCGGLRRDFFSHILQGLKTLTNQDLANGSHSDFQVVNTGNCELLLPQADQIDLPELSIHYHIGVMLGYLYLRPGQDSLLVGRIFHEAVYAAILSLNNSEVDAEELPLETKIRMLDAFLNAIMHGKSDALDFVPALNFLLIGESFTETDLVNEGLRIFFASRSLNKSDNDEVTQGLGEKTLRSRFLGPDGDSLDLAKVQFNQAEIVANKRAFLDECVNLLFDIEERESLNGEWIGYGKLGLLFAPIHAMAKGMKAVAEGRWNEIHSLGTLVGVEGNQDTIRYEGAKTLQRKTQGSIDREEIARNINNQTPGLPLVDTQVGWIREWIRRPETTETQIEGLLTYWTGSSNIDLQKSSRKLEVCGQIRLQHFSSATCFNLLSVPRDRVSTTMGVDNSSREKFFASLDDICKPEHSSQFTRL